MEEIQLGEGKLGISSAGELIEFWKIEKLTHTNQGETQQHWTTNFERGIKQNGNLSYWF